MNTIAELKDYKPVTLNQAKILKRLGFDKPVMFYWQDTDGIPFVEKSLKISDTIMNHNSATFNGITIYSAPSTKDEDVINILTRHLRATTGLGIVQCKKALLNNELDVELALLEIKNMKSFCLI